MAWKWRYLLLTLFLAIFLISLYLEFFIEPQTAQQKFTFEKQQQEITPQNYSVPADKPIILFWNRIFDKQSINLGTDCPLQNRCELTYDHTALPRANAVVFHIPDIKWIHTVDPHTLNYDMDLIPDLPYKAFENNAHQPRVNVFLTHENPSMLVKYYSSQKLSIKSYDYFHWGMTFLHSSHVPMPYGGFWVSPEQTAKLGFPPVKLPSDRETILKDKMVNGIVWLVSNCETSSKREMAVRALAKYIPVTIGGKCAKTLQGKQLCPRSAPNCDHIYSQHYFYIAAENDLCKDYITEKYWDRYKLPVIPIVLRKRIYENRVPNNSFIAMDHFAGPKQMATFLYSLMDNPDKYLEYFAWRDQNWSIAPWNHEGYRIGECALCEKLLRLSTREEPVPKPLHNAVEWFERESQCEGGTFAEEWAKTDQ